MSRRSRQNLCYAHQARVCCPSNILGALLNSALQEAIGDPGVPSNLDMMIYVSKQLASIYKRSVKAFNNLFEYIKEKFGGDSLSIDDECTNKLYSEILSDENYFNIIKDGAEIVELWKYE